MPEKKKNSYCELPFIFFYNIYFYLFTSSGYVAEALGLSSACGTLHGVWDLSSLTKDQTGVPCIARWSLNHWTTREVPSFHL